MFERIMTEKPDVMNKIIPVYGELTKPNFDLSPENLKKVVENTEIMFHLAASINMALPLKPNVMMNLVGTKTALKLAKQMKNLIQMVHTSTAFCNVEPEVVYEKVYDFPCDPEDLIRMAETMDEKTMSAMEKDLLGPHPCTYSFTKQLAEILVEREYGRLPVCIVRPSVVLPSFEEPIPGWVDTIYGLGGLTLAAAKGVHRSMLADPDAHLEVFPVDFCISAMIIIAKVLATSEPAKKIPVYHLTADDEHKFQIKWVFDKVKEYRFTYPLSLSLW